MTLPKLELEYSDIDLPATASVLFKVTNHILTETAEATISLLTLGRARKSENP